MIVAADPYAAEDALELIEVEYEPLPAVVDAEAGLAPARPCSTRTGATTWASPSRCGSATRSARWRTRPSAWAPGSACPATRGCRSSRAGILAEPAARGDGLTVWASTQVPHWLQRTLGETLGLPAQKLRVVAPEVGRRLRDEGLHLSRGRPDPGGLGPARPPREVGREPPGAPPERDPLAGAAARRRAGRHARRPPRGFRDRFLLDLGAYNPWGIVQPYNTVGHTPGPAPDPQRGLSRCARW